MFNMLDIYERAVKGPIMSEKDFDMKVFLPNMKDVVKKYDIRYDKENPVPSDDAAADNLFEAGVEFLTRVGVCCQGTNRVMQFTEEEIRQVLKEAPGQCFPGKGKDAGPNTKMFMYETAAYLLSVVPSGAPAFETSHPAKGVMVDGFSPLEARWNMEMGKAASKLKRAEANNLVNRLLQKYESRIKNPPSGSRYQDCYDAITAKPIDAYIRLYDEVKAELIEMGIPLT